MAPVHTALYVGLFALIYILLSYRVTVFRNREGTSLGVRDPDSELARSVRVHGNFSEYVPFGLLLIAFAEMNGAPLIAVHAMAALLLVARVSHAFGLTHVVGKSVQRYWGTAITFAVVVVAGVWASVLSVLKLMP